MTERMKLSLHVALVLCLVTACGDNGGHSPDAGNPIDAPQTDAPGTASVTINFAAHFGATPFTCGGTYMVGTPADALTVTDLRFYVYDVNLVTAEGVASPVSLTPGTFQSSTVALLDFEDGCGTDGTPAMNTSVSGTVTGGPFTKLRFTLGVPPAQDYLDITTATAPLDVTGMYWVWQYGYKFFKMDASAAIPDTGSGTSTPFFLHLGSSGCPGTDPTAPPSSPCEYPNQAAIELAGFDAASSTVVADVAAVLGASDVTVNMAGTAPGCMSEEADIDCFPILPRMGVNSAAPQVLFTVE